MKEMDLINAEIKKNDCIAPNIFSMELSAPEIAKTARAGQFVMVYLNKGELLLPRPISICDTRPETGTVKTVYQIAGNGTKAMSGMEAGEQIKLLGALGNGFDIKNNPRVALVGGGIGVPPLLMLAKTLSAQGVETDVFLGFRSAPILIEAFRSVANNVFIAAEDGSAGHHGFITDVLQSQIVNYATIYSCGPLPLLRAVSDFATQKEIPCQICMEQRMACGVGACVGCVIKVGGQYVKVCSDGPVFNASEVNFDD